MRTNYFMIGIELFIIQLKQINTYLRMRYLKVPVMKNMLRIGRYLKLLV